MFSPVHRDDYFVIPNAEIVPHWISLTVSRLDIPKAACARVTDIEWRTIRTRRGEGALTYRKGAALAAVSVFAVLQADTRDGLDTCAETYDLVAATTAFVREPEFQVRRRYEQDLARARHAEAHQAACEQRIPFTKPHKMAALLRELAGHAAVQMNVIAHLLAVQGHLQGGVNVVCW